ncbi:MAG: hypothetical protein WCX46_00895 [Candidatus Paceibacterota bacterium]
MEHKNLHEQEKSNLFIGQQNLFDQIYKNGFQNYTQGLPSINEAFIENHSMCCIDEGTPHGIHSAGSGILRDKEEVLTSFRDAGVTEITSHDGCGAAGLYAKSKGLDLSKSDEYAKEWSKEIAKELGVPYRHISSTEMSRPKGLHVSRVAYYDGTGKFDYSTTKELPAGFIISRAIQSIGTSISEATVSFNIATGDHGFGELINQKNPFMIVAIGKDQEHLDKLLNELNDVKGVMGDKVKIDGFIAPN